MGPRPDGRGKRIDMAAVAHVCGVNGAAARRPRKAGRGFRLGIGSHASMGPRPDGRGKGSATRPGSFRLEASMGPRPDGRGKSAGREATRRATIRVNGAAARRPRKVSDIVHTVDVPQASMGPRPDGRGKARVGGGGGARTGRQWGRGQTAAESGNLSAAFVALACVNGAAARRPRKDISVYEQARLKSQRQWGRGQTAAERGGRPERIAEIQSASMGPRPDGRGKLILRDGLAFFLARQWGRGQTAAESRAPAMTPRIVTMRQWGRGQTAAERAASP